MKQIIILIVWFESTVMPQYSTNQKSIPFPWPDGIKCAVSLTFDDSRLSQIDMGIPLLDRFNIKGTFYITPDLTEKHLPDWIEASENGHEIGNHTMTHPCTGNYEFSYDNALEDHTLEKIINDIERADNYIVNHFKIQPKSFAYPCGQKFVGRGTDLHSYVPVVAEQYLTGRGWRDEESNDPCICDLSQLLGVESDGKSFIELKALIEQTAVDGRWLVLAGHEMAHTGEQTTCLNVIEQICRYAENPDNGIWMDTVQCIANYIQDHR